MRVILKSNDISFFINTLDHAVKHILQQQIEAVWPKATAKLTDVQNISVDINRSSYCELTYKPHDIFSLDTSRDENEPMPSLFIRIRDMTDDDVAVIDYLLLPFGKLSVN